MTMKFTPPGWNVGLICLVAGIIILVLFYRYDKKHNAVLLAIARQKRRDASGDGDDKKQKPKQAAVKSATEKKTEQSPEKAAPKQTKQSKDTEEDVAEEISESPAEADDNSE